MYTIDMNLAFYTCFYGTETNKGFVIPPPPSEQYDCLYYTNNKTMMEKLKTTRWIAIYDDKPVYEDLIESAMQSKHIKACPHEYNELKPYDYLCYYDSKRKMDIVLVERLIQKCFQENKYSLIVSEHPFLKAILKKKTISVWDEFHEAMKQERYQTQKDQITNYIHTQLKNGFKEVTNDHCLTGYLIRNMKDPQIIRINNTWYEHIQQCGIECQIAMFFVKQMFQSNMFMTNQIKVYDKKWW